MMMKGCSAGIPPIHVRITTFVMRAQNKSWERGRKLSPRSLDVCRRGVVIRIRMDARRAMTPPSLLGMERRMAYAKRKYHSGLIWGGVTIGLAGVKLSGSPRRFGVNSAMVESKTSMIANPRRSL